MALDDLLNYCQKVRADGELVEHHSPPGGGFRHVGMGVVAYKDVVFVGVEVLLLGVGTLLLVAFLTWNRAIEDAFGGIMDLIWLRASVLSPANDGGPLLTVLAVRRVAVAHERRENVAIETVLVAPLLKLLVLLFVPAPSEHGHLLTGLAAVTMAGLAYAVAYFAGL